jgi:hypothetical protein
MYEFNEIQNKAFYELKTLIIYDLKKNNVDLVVDRDYFLNYYNNNQLIFNSIEEKEKISCTFNFYNYILDPKSAELFLEVFYFITKKKPWIFSNSFLNIFFDSFDNKKISILFYSSILIKTLTNPSYYRKSFYENDSDEIINADSWHESTNVLETQFILINNFIIYNNIKIFIDDINKKNVCFSNLFKFISILKNENIIKEKIIKRIHKKKIKTYKYWSIAEESNLMHLICETNFSSLPYTLINHLGVLYEKGSHFSKIILLCRKNWYSGEIFNVKDDKYIKKILNLKLYINKESLIDIQKMILESEKIKITEIKKKINDYSIDLKSIFNKKTIGDKEKEEIKRIQKYLNKLIDIERMSRMIENLKEEECKYLPIFFDFRGRNYFDDYLSPTFSRWTRISFYYGYYSVEDLEKVDNSFIEPFLNHEVLSLIKEILKIFEIEEKKYTINAIFWLLIAIGKHFIDKSKIKIPLIDFIKEGYNYAAGYKENKKMELKELIEIKHYLNIIKNLKKKENIKKEVILKDATASVLQNLIKILGPKNQEAINLSNLGDTNNWYDPYSHILNQFKKSFEADKKEFIYFKRSTIKKTIMTNPYSAGEDKCWEYFKKSVIKEFDIKENEKLDDLRETFKSFYNFVTDFFEELNFFKNSSKKIIDYYIKIAQKEKKIILSYEDSNINLIYFKHKIHYIDIKIDNEIRKTKKIKNIDYSKINYRKIFTSIRANLAHWLDAIFLRKLVNRLKNPIFTIHDEFAIDFLNTDNLIILANEIANEDIKIEIPWDKSHKFKIFSIFILI